MHLLAAELKQRELSRHIGTQVEVLWEQQINADTGQWIGYTPHYHKIVSAASSIYAASISQVSVDSLSDDSTMLANSARQAQVRLAEIGQHGA
jgi:tRNA A37 methylthiotransferase MiaB